MQGGEGPNLALSRDGRTLVYVAGPTGNEQLYVRELDQLKSTVLSGTEGAASPFVSPDGSSVGFVQDMVLKRVPIRGGPVTEIGGARIGSYAGASWGDDGSIVYAPLNSRVLWRVDEGGGVPQQITALDEASQETSHFWPQSIDGGSLVLYTAVGPSMLWTDAQVVLEDLGTGERRTVVDNGTHARYVAGHVIYANSAGTLLAVPFDLSNRSITGAAFPVATDVRVGNWGGGASFAVSDAGTAAFVHGAHPERALLQWVDREGQVLAQLGPPLTTHGYLDLSPDGTRLVTGMGQPSNLDVWMIDAATADRDRLTFDAAVDETPVWSSDGQRVAFWSFRTVDGGGELRVSEARTLASRSNRARRSGSSVKACGKTLSATSRSSFVSLA